jgi:hypothetical protein
MIHGVMAGMVDQLLLLMQMAMSLHHLQLKVHLVHGL